MRVGGKAGVSVERPRGIMGDDGGAKGGQLEEEYDVEDGMEDKECGDKQELGGETCGEGRKGGGRARKRINGCAFLEAFGGQWGKSGSRKTTT